MNKDIGEKLYNLRLMEETAKIAFEQQRLLREELESAVRKYLKERSKEDGLIVVELPDGSGVLIRTRSEEDRRFTMMFEDLDSTKFSTSQHQKHKEELKSRWMEFINKGLNDV